MTYCIYNLAKRRKTVRRFSKTPISWSDIKQALVAACETPSGANCQPWRFMMIIDPLTKKKLREICERVEKTFYSKVNGELRDWLFDKGLTWKGERTKVRAL